MRLIKISITVLVWACLLHAFFSKPNTHALVVNSHNNEQQAPASEMIVDSQVMPVAFQQHVDNFSNDARAMSPRSWGAFHQGSSNEPSLPQVSFDSGDPIESLARPESLSRPESLRISEPPIPNYRPSGSPMMQVKNSGIREPEPFYEQNRLDPSMLDASEFSSPLPIETGNQETSKPQSGNKLESRLENGSRKPAQQQLIDPNPVIQQLPPPNYIPNQDLAGHVFSDPSNYPYPMFGDTPHNVLLCEQCQPKAPTTCRCNRCQTGGRFRRNNKKPTESHQGFCQDDCCNNCLPTKYNEKLGHRYDYPASRGFRESSSSKFSFEEDGDFPPASEILANSVFWSEFEYLALQPSFQGNTAITASGPTSSTSTPFNFELNSAFRVAAGFESDYGARVRNQLFSIRQRF